MTCLSRTAAGTYAARECKGEERELAAQPAVAEEDAHALQKRGALGARKDADAQLIARVGEPDASQRTLPSTRAMLSRL